MYLLTVLKLEIHPGARASFSCGLSSPLADGHLLGVLTWPFLWAHTCGVRVERDKSGVSSSFHKDTNPIRLGPHPYDLI